MFDNINTTNGEYNVQYLHQYGTYSGTTFNSKVTTSNYTLPSNELNFATTTKIRSSLSSENPMAYVMRDQYLVYPMGDVKMASKGESISFSIDNILQSMIGIDGNGNMGRYSYFNPAGIKWIEYIVYDKNMTGAILETVTTNFNVRKDGATITIGGEFNNVPFDVYGANICIVYDPALTFDNNQGDTDLTGSVTDWKWTTIKHGWGYDESHLTININDNTAGLLSSIIEFIVGILDGVTKIFGKIGDFMTSVANSFSTLFTKLGNWFGDLIDSILELPSKIWNLIESGLKKLFIPSVDYMEEYQDKYSNLFKERFGLLYECVTLIDEFFGNLDVSTKQNFIEIPSVTVDLAGEDFTFGGYQMQIVPTKFEFLADAVKTLTSIICSFGFVIAMKNRFTRLLERG